MNRAKKLSKSRGTPVTFTATEVEPNHQSNQKQTETELPIEPEANFDRTAIKDALLHSDKSQGVYTAVAIASASSVTDTAIRKALKQLKQVLPEESLVAENKRLTDLAQALMYQYFRRPDDMSGAAWIYELRQVVGALPESEVSVPITPDKHWKEVVEDAEQECTALSLNSEAMLARLRALQDSDDIGDDEAFEAEKKRIEEVAYQRQVALELARLQGAARARADIRKTA